MSITEQKICSRQKEESDTFASIWQECKKKDSDKDCTDKRHPSWLSLHRVSHPSVTRPFTDAKVYFSFLRKNDDDTDLHELKHQLSALKEAIAKLEKRCDMLIADSNSSPNVHDSLKTFNLMPSSTVRTYLKEIDYANSAQDALEEDWRNIGHDLWVGLAKFTSSKDYIK